MVDNEHPAPNPKQEEPKLTKFGNVSRAEYTRKWRRERREKTGLNGMGLMNKKDQKHLDKRASIVLTIKYKPLDRQKLFSDALDAGKKVVLFVGGIRAGKTYSGARETLKNIYQRGINKKGLGWIISPTYPMSAIVEREFEAACDLGNGKSLIIKKYVGSRSYLLVPPPGHRKPYRVEVKTAEHPDRLRGSSLDWIWMDEAAMMEHEAYKILMGRVLDTGGPIVMTTTPRGMNWLYHEVYAKAEKNPEYFAVIKALTTENTYLPFEDVEELRGQYSTTFAKQELNAEFVSLEGLVYNNFDFNRHVLKEITRVPAGAEIICGLDAGFKDPFVCLFVMKLKDKFYVIDEYYSVQRTMEQHGASIKSNWLAGNVLRRWMDPSAAQEAADLHGLGVGSFPAKNDIRGGINSVARLIETDRLFVMKNCIQTLNELSQYCYKDSTARNSGETPIDKTNHCVTGDSWIDCVNGRFQIKDLVGRKDVYVWAFDGEVPRAKKASDIRKTRTNAPIVKVTFDNTSLTLTADHLVMRKDGSWVEAGKLKNGDRVRALYKSAMARGYVHLRTGRGHSRYEAAHRLVWESLNGPIPNGHVIHHKDEQTLNNHPDNLELMTREAHIAHHQPTWVAKSLAKTRGRIPYNLAKNIETTCAYCEKKFIQKDKTTARRTCSRKCHTGLRIHNHRVLSVEPHGTADVYNMEVADLHNFVANGVCVHNCMDALRYVIYSEDGYARNHPFVVQGEDGSCQLMGLAKPQSLDEWIALKQAYPVGEFVAGGEDYADF